MSVPMVIERAKRKSRRKRERIKPPRRVWRTVKVEKHLYEQALRLRDELRFIGLNLLPRAVRPHRQRTPVILSDVFGLGLQAVERAFMPVIRGRRIEEKVDEAARVLVAARTAMQIATWLEDHLAGLQAGILTPEDCVEDAYAEIAQRIRYHEWEADLDECADCGGSTAPGTPDPHVCR